MKKIFLIFIFGFFYSGLFSQKENFQWGVGASGLMDFNSGSLVLGNTQDTVYCDNMNASICDSNGQLIILTNGTKVFNSQYDTMLNSYDFNDSWFKDNYNGGPNYNYSYGLPVPQGAIIIPYPGNDSLYFIFHETVTDSFVSWPFPNFKLYYSIVNIHLDNGLGTLTTKNIFMEDSLIMGEMTAVKHGNGRDWWLLAKEDQSNRYFKWLITPYTINGPIIQDISPVWMNNHGGLQASFNHQGNKYAIARADSRKVELYNFDRCTGNLSNRITLSVQDSVTGGMGVCFSSNDNYMYVTTGLYIYQYDIFASDINASKFLIDTWDSTWTPYPTSFIYMLSAPDYKIYISNGIAYNVMNVINLPDSAGLACNEVQHPFIFPTSGISSPPNLPDYSLGAKTGSPCDTLTTIVENHFSNPSYSIIPNPSNDRAILKYCTDNESALTISVTDMMGRSQMQSALSTNCGQKDLDVHTLQGGIYYFNICSHDKLLLKGKFAVMH